MKCPRFLNDRFIQQYKIYGETRGGFPQALFLVNKEATAFVKFGAPYLLGFTEGQNRRRDRIK